MKSDKPDLIPKLIRLTKAQDKWLRDHRAATGVDASTAIRLLLEREMKRGS